MLRIPVTYDLNCILPTNRKECTGKPAHCYITRNFKIVAVVWLDPVCIEKGSDLLNYEKEEVLLVVSENKYELEEAYRKVANGW